MGWLKELYDEQQPSAFSILVEPEEATHPNLEVWGKLGVEGSKQVLQSACWAKTLVWGMPSSFQPACLHLPN